MVAERYAAGAPGAAAVAATADRQMTDFLAERHRGTKPIAWGRQLQELFVAAGIYGGVLGLDSLLGNGGDGEVAPEPVSTMATARHGER
jgi:hypothetical protein